MYGEKAIGLIKQLDRNRDNLPPYNVSCAVHFSDVRLGRMYVVGRFS